MLELFIGIQLIYLKINGGKKSRTKNDVTEEICVVILTLSKMTNHLLFLV